ncbi:unnamed protein product [Cylindrotheca closterium]|uniref:Aminotransferase class V domain-containing protein n=1 Tax=Cylindrotheca closterium TaxID=2856 RepID=A0AAD2FUN5_9STRA|nr:unnamed protein product [Cylindrotheca closterium]
MKSTARLQHTKGYQAMGSFHSDDVDLLMSQSDRDYKPPQLPFDPASDNNLTFNHQTGGSDFLLDPNWTFLNHGAFGASLKVGYERAEQWRYHLERQPLRYFDRDLLPHLVYSARQLADFCQVSHREGLTLIPNVTYGLNTIISGYVEEFREDSHIILWDTTYGSLKKMAEEYCNKVTEVSVIPYFDKAHELNEPSEIFAMALEDALAKSHHTTKHALLILDQTTSNTAINMPLRNLTRIAKERDMLVMVDGAHGLLANEVILDDSAPDFYLSNGHKWLSCPRGVAMIYCPKEELRDSILRRPAVISHGFGQGYQSRFLWDGCRDYAAALSLPVVLDFWRSKGVASVQESNQNRLRLAVSALGNAWHGRSDDSVTLVPMRLHGPTMALVRLPDSYQSAISTSDDAKYVQDMLFDRAIEVPINAGYVQANSVQSQFAALTKDRDKFQNEKDDAERESKRAQERLRRLKQEQVALLTKNQACQECLGTLSRKQTMLQQEENRLRMVTQSERKALEACAAHTSKLVKQEKEMTKKFTSDMGKANGEAARLLGQQLIDKIVKNVSVDSVKAVVSNSTMSTSCKVKLEQMKLVQQKLGSECARYEEVKDEFRRSNTSCNGMPSGGATTTQAESQMEIFYSVDA